MKRSLPWQSHAACAGRQDLFLPDSEAQTARQVRDAKAICAGCTVLTPCRDAALGNEDEVGIWGGMTTRERNTARLKMRQLAS